MMTNIEHITLIVKLNLKSSLCDYSDKYIFVSGTITLPSKGTAAAPNNRKNVII